MMKERRSISGAGLFAALALCVLVAAGCSKPEEAADNSSPPTGKSMKGKGETGRPGEGPGKPLAETASGAEIYQAKCRCHGAEGKGGKAPNLTNLSSRSDTDLYKIIHDGREKMPAFGSQLSEGQIKKVVAYLKELKPGK